MRTPIAAEPVGRHVGNSGMNLVTRLLPVMAMAQPTPAWACTLCHSRLAEDVRAALFGPDFWGNLTAVTLPIPVLVAATCVVRKYLL